MDFDCFALPRLARSRAERGRERSDLSLVDSSRTVQLHEDATVLHLIRLLTKPSELP